jgi:hypothetical protein
METGNQHADKVDVLKRITLAVQAGSSGTTYDLIPEPVNIEFIFGICPEGLSPFEFTLSGKSSGEHVELTVPADQIHITFHHIPIPFFNTEKSVSKVFFKATVIGIDTPSPKEVVKSLAQLANCGGGDCSCCGH